MIVPYCAKFCKKLEILPFSPDTMNGYMTHNVGCHMKLTAYTETEEKLLKTI